MSVWSSLIGWAISSAKDSAKKAALQAIQQGATQLTQAIATHAPDVSEIATAKINEAITTAVAGVLSKAH